MDALWERHHVPSSSVPQNKEAKQTGCEPDCVGNEKIMNYQDRLFVNVREINEQRLLHNTEGMKSIRRSENNEGINRITRLRPE